MTDRKKILVARIGAFGDVCMLAPLVRAVARRHEVHWLIRDAYEPVIRGFPEVDCRLVGCAPGPDPKRPFSENFVESLRRERYDCLVDCSHWACVGWLARRLTDVPVRATTADPRQDALLAVDRGPEGLDPFNVVVPVTPAAHHAEHQLATWRRLFRAACGIEVEPDWTLPDRPAIGTSRPLRVFLHPHAGKPEKIWPVGRFARVLTAAARQRPIECTVNGVRRRIVRGLRMRMLMSHVRLEVAPFDASFATLRDALLQSDLAIGCDSGPMHYASLLGVPTLVLYGRYSAAEFAPLWRSTAVEPPSGRDVDALPVAAVGTAFESLVRTLGHPAGLRGIAA